MSFRGVRFWYWYWRVWYWYPVRGIVRQNLLLFCSMTKYLVHRKNENDKPEHTYIAVVILTIFCARKYAYNFDF